MFPKQAQDVVPVHDPCLASPDSASDIDQISFVHDWSTSNQECLQRPRSRLESAQHGIMELVAHRSIRTRIQLLEKSEHCRINHGGWDSWRLPLWQSLQVNNVWQHCPDILQHPSSTLLPSNTSV